MHYLNSKLEIIPIFALKTLIFIYPNQINILNLDVSEVIQS